MSHTPGPWEGANSMADRAWNIYASCGGPVIALVPHKSGKDNARLIAAAPDLLAALKTIMAHPRTDDRSIVFMLDEAKDARAAIAKAEAQ